MDCCGEAKTWTLVILLLLLGSATTLLDKATFDTVAVGRDGKEGNVSKPYFLVWWMFASMVPAVPLDMFIVAWKRRRTLSAAPEEAAVKPEHCLSLHNLLRPLIPAMFDLVGSIFVTIGLQWILSSVWQMLRSILLVATALLAVLFLKRKLSWTNISGLALCIIGVGLVALTSFLSGRGSESYAVSPMFMGIGVALVGAGQLTQACQLVTEDFFMANLHMRALTLVGLEGVYGLLLTTCLMSVVHFLPGPAGVGLHEDSIDTFVMIANSQRLQLLLALSFLTSFGLNTLCLLVTRSLGSVFRSVTEATRTVVVWVAGLAMFCFSSNHDMGEAWTFWSPVQVAGLVFILAGTILYRFHDTSTPEASQQLAALEKQQQQRQQQEEEANYCVLELLEAGACKRFEVPGSVVNAAAAENRPKDN